VPLVLKAVEILLLVSLLGAVVSEAVASRRARIERFSPWLAGAAVFALHFERSFQSDDPAGSLLPAVVFALLLGAGGALLIGTSLRALLSIKRPPQPRASTP
jgi:hypothetical protein